MESLGRFPGPRHHSVDFAFSKDLDLNAMATIYEALYIRLRDELLKDVVTD